MQSIFSFFNLFSYPYFFSPFFFPLKKKKQLSCIAPFPPHPFCRYIIMYGSNCRTLDNSDVKENETFFCWGWGIVLVLWHRLTSFTFGCTTLFCIPVLFFFFIVFWLVVGENVHPGSVEGRRAFLSWLVKDYLGNGTFSFFSNSTRRL